MLKKYIYDLELYPNRILLGTMLTSNPKKIYQFDNLEDIKKIQFNSKKYLWIGFNNRYYDQCILDFIQQNDIKSIYDVYNYSKRLIREGERGICWSDKIVDLYEILPLPSAQKCSLIEIGHRLKYPCLDLVSPFDKNLNEDEFSLIKLNNVHYLKITFALWKRLKDVYYARQNLRKFFPIKTEFGGLPNLAQKAIISRLGKYEQINETEKLTQMNNLKLSDDMNELYDHCFSYNISAYETNSVPEIGTDYDVNGCQCTLGKGGLHGISETGFYSDVYEYDVTSYYPNIIINCELGSKAFRRIYGNILEKRIDLKTSGDKVGSDSLKLVLNSLSGKMKSREYAHPKVRSPSTNVSMCMLGQFYLIDLIEKLDYGTCIMANTDGIVIKGKMNPSIKQEWERRTGFNLEERKYKHFIMADVNSYYAVDYEGNEKRLKDFRLSSWDRVGKAPIIQQACLDFMLKGIPTMTTLTNSRDIYDFCFFTKVKSIKAYHLTLNDNPISEKKVRYYISHSGSVLKKDLHGKIISVHRDANVTLCPNLIEMTPDVLNDINYAWYLDQVNKLLTRISYEI